MTIDYAAVKKEVPRMKAALTKARNSKDPARLKAAAEKALDRFRDIGFPDGWRLWESALRDAEWALARGLKLK